LVQFVWIFIVWVEDEFGAARMRSRRYLTLDPIYDISRLTLLSEIGPALADPMAKFGFTALGINGLPPPAEGSDPRILAEIAPWTYWGSQLAAQRDFAWQAGDKTAGMNVAQCRIVREGGFSNEWSNGGPQQITAQSRENDPGLSGSQIQSSIACRLALEVSLEVFLEV
jgi:hypothetical protein